MQKEVQALAPSNLTPEVFAPADRKHSAWLGGAILSSMDTFESMFIKKSEYEEEGHARIVHRKCFWLVKNNSLYLSFLKNKPITRPFNKTKLK